MRLRRIDIITVFGIMLSCLIGASLAWADQEVIDGFGKLKFGMTQEDVKTVPGCTSDTECLIDIGGKNRYMTLAYQPPVDAPSGPHTNQHPAKLSRIDIDMGLYNEDVFANIFLGLKQRYALTHDITEEQDRKFQKGELNELVLAFARYKVLLKIIRRPFGNLIMRVIYQDEVEAKDTALLFDHHPSTQGR